MKETKTTVMRLLLLVICFSITTAATAQHSMVTFRDIVPVKEFGAFWPGHDTVDTVHIAYDSSMSNQPIYLRFSIDSIAAKMGARVTCIGGECQLLDSANGMVAALDSNLRIDEFAVSSTYTWSTPDTVNGELLSDPYNGTGNWQQALDKYLGYRVKINNTWRYGWAQVSVIYAFGSGIFTIRIHNTLINQLPDDPVTTSQPTSIGNVATQLKDVNISMQGNTVYLHNVGTPYSYSITDMNGRVMNRGNDQQGNFINLPAMASGMYILHIENSDGYYNTKLMK